MCLYVGSPLFAAWLVYLAILGGAGQTHDDSHSQPILLKALVAEYPPIAKAAHVSGDVHLHLMIRKDGTVESADVVEGPAMLRSAAIAGAKTVLFDCKMCTEESMPYSLIMRFQITSTDPPKSCDEPIPQGFHVAIDPIEHLVTVSTPQIWTCDPAVETSTRVHRVRSARCMYLWRCAWRSEK
jgi:hypothetical protein